MEPRHEEQRKAPEQSRPKTKRRFAIEKLEERIAPCAYKYRGRNVHYQGPCGGHK